MNKTVRVQDWEALAEAVREELRECAWLLSLMDRQQKTILLRDREALVDVSGGDRVASPPVEELPRRSP
jgi:hypothetical protein